MIEVKNLTKYYGFFKAVDNISFNVEKGRIHGFIGPNGSGKTTTLNIISTLLEPTDGDVFVGGLSITKHPIKVREIIGYMPDEYGIYDGFTVYGFLTFVGKCYSVPKRVREERINFLLNILNISDLKGRNATKLSKGQTQKVYLAKILIPDPEVILMDEPASGLDPLSRIEFKRYLIQLKEKGKTIFVSSHILPDLEEVCDDLTIIHEGKVLASGKKEEVLSLFSTKECFEIIVSDGEISTVVVDNLKSRFNAITNITIKERTIVVEWNDRIENFSEVISFLVNSNIKIYEVKKQVKRLESLYMELIQKA